MKKSKYLQKLIFKLAQSSFKDGRIIESQVAKSIKLLKALPAYQAIPSLSEYLKLIKRKERQTTMYIETVVNLPKSTIEKMKRIVEKKIKITKIVTNINTEILGGFKLRIGDEIWDETILGKINQIKEAIAGKAVAES